MNTQIREYVEEMGVVICTRAEVDRTVAEQKLPPEVGDRLVVFALYEGGYNSTAVDLADIIAWVKENKPEMLPKS